MVFSGRSAPERTAWDGGFAGQPDEIATAPQGGNINMLELR
jgi:hypothetical protein